MFGIAGLTLSGLALIAGIFLLLDFYANKFIMAFPVVKLLSGLVEPTPATKIFAGVLILIGTGFLSLGAVSGAITDDFTASQMQTYGADVVLVVSGTDGTDFADTGYEMYLLDYNTYAAQDKYDIFAEVVDYGTGSLVSPDGGTATAETVSSGKFIWDDQSAKVGDRFIVFGFDDTSLGAGDYQLFKTEIEIQSYQAEQGTWSITPNRHQLYTLGAIDTYNYASTDVTGYVEDQDTATSDMSINYDTYCNADNNISMDMGLYIELDSTMQGKIDKITITPSGEGADPVTITSFLDTSNMDTSNPIFESAPTKQSSDNNMYYVTMLPDSHRTSSTNKDKTNIAIQYDHPGSGNHPFYTYEVMLVPAGDHGHFDINAAPAFTHNATDSGTDGWTTA